MNIEFTKTEYQALLKLVQISDWILNAHKTSDEPQAEAERAVVQKIYSHAKEMGCEKIIEYSQEENQFVETSEAEFESDARQCIEEYDEDTFWAELVERLATRDSIEKHTQQVFEKLPESERVEIIEDTEAAWMNEINEHGLKRMGIVSS